MNMKLFLLITTLMLCCSLPLVGIADSTSTHTVKEKQEPHNADYYYNQAVRYFDSGNQAYANLYYLKALNLDSAHKQARANLELSIRLSADSKLYPQHKFLVNATYRMLWFFSVNRLAIISLILLLLASLCLAWLLFYDPDKERALPLLSFIALCLMCLGSFTLLGFKSYQQRNNKLGVLISPTEQLLSGSSTAAISEVHAGLIVTILDIKDDYYLLRLPDGQSGRLPRHAVARVLQQ